MIQQHCVVRAWRETCARKFCVPEGGAHCPDFTRDVGVPDDTGTVTVGAGPLSCDRRHV